MTPSKSSIFGLSDGLVDSQSSHVGLSDGLDGLSDGLVDPRVGLLDSPMV